MNALIHKGNYVVLGIVLTDYDGNIDTTTAVSAGATTGLLVEPAAAGAANRTWYVSVPTAATVSQTGQTVTLSATIQATGSGVGAPPVTKQISFSFDTVVPVDHRAIAAAVDSPSVEAPLPHP